MSGYILCQTKRAESPFFIENISTNIYSLEELCYYLYHNIYLIDDSIFNERLCDWIQNELELPKLATKLRVSAGKLAGVEDLLYPVFKEINYLTYEEMKNLNVLIHRFNEEQPALREKQKGDALVENEMYVHAIRVYQALLQRTDLEEVREGLTESIYHNLGCAYSYLFQMEEAIECFYKAYEQKKSREALKTWLLAIHSVRTPAEYRNMAAEAGADKELLEEVKKQLEHFERKPEPQVEQQKVDAMLDSFTREYHRNTGS